ncbi:alpha/beta fold hydrolase [Archangium primigenium]|nr:alpha/beta fold hydrolase [Archangium primigenium]
MGSGPRRIGLVHGLGADASTWEPFIEQLRASGQVTVFAPDLRGHGRSARAESWSLAEFADDLVETLPHDLDVVVGHSLGGAVLAAAVERLRPGHAVYLDPGFQLGLPTTGLRGRLFWAVPALTLGVAALLTARASAAARKGYPERTRRLMADATKRFDKRMAIGIFRDIAFHPVAAARPPVPSTVVLSADSKAVLPEGLATALTGFGWDVRRLSHLHHDMQLQDPAATFTLLRDVLLGP